MIRSPSGYAPVVPPEDPAVARKPRTPPAATAVAGVPLRRGKRKPRHRP